MNRSEGIVGILAPEGPDRELIRGIIESRGWQPTFPAEGSHPEGPWLDVDVIVVDASWLERCRAGLLATKRDAGSEFVPVLLVTPREVAPGATPPLCDGVHPYPTTRAAFAARVESMMRARRESRRVYQSFFENTLVGVYRATMEGVVLMANDALARLLGCSDLAEIRARGVRIPELREADAGNPGPLVDQLEGTGVAEVVPGRWPGEDDREIHVRHSARLIRPVGEIHARPVVEGTVQEVTDLVESRERLARSEHFLQSAIDALSSHVAILSPEARIIGVNRAWRNFEPEVRAEDASDLGVDYLEVCRQADDASAREVAEGIRAVIQGERPVFETEYPCHSPTRYRWFRVVVTPFPEEPPRKVVVAHENVSELREAQRRFQLLIEGSSELTAVVGETGIIEYGSPPLAEFLGRRQLKGHRLEEFVHPSDRELLGRLPERIAADATTDFRIRGRDGSWRDIEWAATDLRDEPIVNGFVLHGRDVTERKNMLAQLDLHEREIREMQKMEAVGRLAGGLAHDFNNLLTAIQGNLDLARLSLGDVGAAEGEEIDEYLSEIGRAAEQGAFLTQRLLVFSRKEIETDPSVRQLGEILESLGKLLQRLVSQRIDFTMEIADDRPLPVRVRPGEIEQVVVNLTVNAGHAMPQGGDLTIRAYAFDLEREGAGQDMPAELAEGAYAVIEVIDTGVGIPEELQEKIFEPFFTTKPQGEGTGLGLATVYGIVSRAGGAISVDSEPGMGSRFTVHLPLAAEAPHEANSRKAPARADVGGAETILLVEDETSVRTVVRRGLEHFGFTVLEAEDGRKALEILDSPRGEGIALVITDFVMPVMSGIELAKAMHAWKIGIPVLITSGYPDSDLDLPSDLQWETLSKPYHLSDLAAVVRSMITEAGEADPGGRG